MNAADPSGPMDPQARDVLRRHLTSAAEATSAAVGLAVMARALDAEALDSATGWVAGWTPYTRDCLLLALEVLAGAAHQHLVDAGRADGFDVENGFDDQHTVPATAGLGGGA